MIEKIGLPHRETIDATTEHAEEIERNAGNVVKTMEEENKRMDTNSRENSACGVIYKKVKSRGFGKEEKYLKYERNETNDTKRRNMLDSRHI